MTTAPQPLPDHDLLHQLVTDAALTPEDLSRVHAERQRGASLYTALALATDERVVWAHLARTHGKTHLTSHKDLRVFFTDLFDHHVALRHQILPWRTRGNELQVVTYHPAARDGANGDLNNQVLHHTLVSPTVWRYLYDLAYPTSRTGILPEAEAQALVTLTPLGEATTTTPEQRAEILAMTDGFHYIDVRRDPVHEDVRTIVTTPVKRHTRSYPHRFEGNRLVVMMVDPHDTWALQQLKQQTQRDLIITVTTEAVVEAMIQRDLDDGLWREDP